VAAALPAAQGEDLSKAEVIAPRLEHLVTITGRDPDQPVQGIEFRGLRFEHANWLYRGGKESYVGAQAWKDWNYWNAGPGAVELTHTDGIRFAGNVFRNLGGVGLKLVQGTHATRDRAQHVSGHRRHRDPHLHRPDRSAEG
jgi:hypothetical protein